MVNYILEFNAQEDAQACLYAINTMAADYWQAQGYTVIDVDGQKQLIGKKNGVDNPDAQRTLTWDTIKESPNETYYFASLSNDVRFYNPPDVDWKVMLDNTYGFTAIGTEKELPDEW